MSYAGKIDVVGEADDKAVPGGRRRNFQEGDPSIQDPLPEHHDVHVECWDLCIVERLPDREEELDLLKEVIPKSHHDGLCRADPEPCHLGAHGDTWDAGAPLLEREELVIDGHPTPAIGQRHASVPRTPRNTVPRVDIF